MYRVGRLKATAYSARQHQVSSIAFRHSPYTVLWVTSRAGKNRFARPVGRIKWVLFYSVSFDYTIHISNITMFGNGLLSGVVLQRAHKGQHASPLLLPSRQRHLLFTSQVLFSLVPAYASQTKLTKPHGLTPIKAFAVFRF